MICDKHKLTSKKWETSSGGVLASRQLHLWCMSDCSHATTTVPYKLYYSWRSGNGTCERPVIYYSPYRSTYLRSQHPAHFLQYFPALIKLCNHTLNNSQNIPTNYNRVIHKEADTSEYEPS